MKIIQLIYILFLFLFLPAFPGAGLSKSVWPRPPDTARLEYVSEIDCRNLIRHTGFWGKLKSLLGGNSDLESLSLPFDVLVTETSTYFICQDLPALAEIDRDKKSFRLHYDKENPIAHPISICSGGGDLVFMTDSEQAAVYKYSKGKIERFINTGLLRPTGIAALPAQKRLFIVDTGEHNVKIFDYDGNLLRIIPDEKEAEIRLHYPTFASATGGGRILINDALNYRVRCIDSLGNFVFSFGQEGDGPGTFSRPKGLATDSEGHIYIVDNMFDNFQVFDSAGKVLLIVGSPGRATGEFWSPAGIDIYLDTIFVADTFNDRIQIFHYLGEQE